MPAVVLGLLMVLGFAQSGFAQSADGPLNFENNFFVTGDYVVGGAQGMNANFSNGFTKGTITIPDANPGIQPGATADCVVNGKPATNCVPAGAEILAAFLYWQTVEKTGVVPGGPGSGQNGFFGLAPTKANPAPPSYAISGADLMGQSTVSFSGGGCTGSSTGKLVRTYRASVIAYLPQDPTTGAILPNTSYQVTLPSVGASTPLTLGATLVIIYRVLSPNVPLNSIVIYDGAYAPGGNLLTMSQTMQGFYEAASNPVSRLTHIVGDGHSNKFETVSLHGIALSSLYGKNTPPFPGYYGGATTGYGWDNPTWTFPEANSPNPVPGGLKGSITTMVAPNASNQGCVSWGAIIFSTTVQNTDGDGLLDAWKTNQGYCDASMNEGQCTKGNESSGWVDLSGAVLGTQASRHKDLFVQLDYMCSSVTGMGACDTTNGNYSFDPGPATGAILGPVVTAFGNRGIDLHIIHGNAIQEAKCIDDDPTTTSPALCPYPGQPGVVGWKGGLVFIQNQLIDPPSGKFCTTSFNPGNCVPVLQSARKDSYHYALFSHGIGLPGWSLSNASLTSVEQSGTTVTFTTSTPHGLTADPTCTGDNNPLGRVTVAFAISNTNLDGTFCINQVTSTTFSIGPVANSTKNPTYYTFQTDPDLEVGSGHAGTISGFSDIGGQDSVISIASWGADATPTATTGTFMHELGHSLGLTHGGFYYEAPNSYVPTVELNCKPNYQSVMNYTYQIDLLDPGNGNVVPDYSGQGLATIDKFAGGSNPFGGNLPYLDAWHGTAAQFGFPLGAPGILQFHCDGSPKAPNEQDYRVARPASSFAWVSGQDINFDGLIPNPPQIPDETFHGYDDWTHTVPNTSGVDLRQIGGTGSLAAAAIAGGGRQIAGGGGRQVGAGGGQQFGAGGGRQVGAGGGLGDLNQTIANSFTRSARSLTASEAASPRKVTLNWLVPTFGQIGSYNIYRAVNGTNSFTVVGTVSGNPPTTTFTDTVTCNSAGYQYYVTAVLGPSSPNPGQESAPSNTVSTILPDTTDPLTGCYALAAGMNSVSVIGFASPTNGAVYTQGNQIPIAIPVTDDYYPKNGPVPVTANKTLVAIGPLPYDGNCPLISNVPVFLNYQGTYPQPYTILSSGGSGFGLSNNQFTYSWDTTNFNAGCYVFEADFDSGQVNQTEVQLLIFESDTTPHITQTTLPIATAGISYTQNTIQESGGIAPFTWSITAGALPPGMSFNSSGTVSGTPTTAGTYNFTVKVVDKNLNYGTQQFSLKVLMFVSKTLPPTLTTTLNTGTAGTAYADAVLEYGGTVPVTWSNTSPLPAGLLLNASTGAITGTPTTAGTYNFTLQVVDSASPQNVATQTFTVKVLMFVSKTLPPTLTTTLNTGTAGTAYADAVLEYGGTVPVTWSNTSPLPAGLLLNASTGAITGTPTTAGNYSFTLQVVDSASPQNVATQTFTLKVLMFVSKTLPPPTLTTTLLTGTAGLAYSDAVFEYGGTGTITFTNTSPLPAGLSLSATGAITGTPTTAGTSNFTVKVTDSATPQNVATQTFTVTVLMFVSKTLPPTLTTTLLTGTAGTTYNDAVLEYGGTGTITFTNTSPLPAGLSLSSTGTITGTPTAAGTYNFTVQVTDSASPQNVATQTFTVTVLIFVSDMPAAPVDKTLPNATLGTAYSNTIDDTGAAPGTVTWSITAGALPPGLSLGLNTGMVSGTPTAPGNYNFTAQVTDLASPPNVASQAFTLSVADAQYGDLIVVDGASTANPLAGTVFRITPSGTSGTIAAIANGSPRGVAVDGNSGNIYVAVDAVGGSGTSRIVKVDPFGAVIDQFISGILTNPVAVAVDGSGNVYVGDNQLNAIYEFNSAGAQVGNGPFASLPSSKNVPNDIRMAFDSSGNLDVASDSIGGLTGQIEVDQIAPGGALTVLYNTTTQSTATYGLTQSSDPDASTGNVTYTLSGTFSTPPQPGTSITISGFAITANNGPFTVGSSTSNTLVVNNPSGGLDTSGGTAAVQLTQIGTVGGITVLATGSIDLADYGAQSIYNIANPGAANMSITTAFNPLAGNISGMANPPSVGNTNLYTTLNGATPQLDLVVPETPSVTTVNTTYTLMGAETALGGNTAYGGTLSATIPVGSLITINGFTNPLNNGTFVVVSSSSSQLVVVNANGLAETHGGLAQTVPLTSPNDVAWYSKH